jgi:hypothetical protein
MMKPWQTPSNKAPCKVRKKEQKERTQVPAKKNQKPKVSHKGPKEQIMFQSPHHSLEAYQKKKGMGSINSIHTSHSSSPFVSPIVGSLSSSIQQVAILQVILCHHNLWH